MPEEEIYLSPRMRALMERKGTIDLSGVKVVETGSKLVGVEQNNELEKKKQITADVQKAVEKIPQWALPTPDNTVNHLKYKEEVKEANERLKKEGILIGNYLRADLVKDQESKDAYSLRRAKAREMVRKLLEEETLTDEEVEIMKQMNLFPHNLYREEAQQQPVQAQRQEQVIPPRQTGTREEQQRGPEARPEPRRGRIATEEDVRREIPRIGAIEDRNFRANAYSELAKKAHNLGLPTELINSLNSLSNENRTRTEIPGLPERNNVEGWTKWYRERLAVFLDPDLEEEKKTSRDQNPFLIEVETQMGGKHYEDGLLYMPESIKDQVEAEKASIMKLRECYFKWKKDHQNLKLLTTEIENEDLPNNELIGKFLNNLASENGEADGGSKRIAYAISLYWRMARMKAGERSDLRSGYTAAGYDGVGFNIPSIFNTALSKEEIMGVREIMARSCGGSYYEAVGLAMARFLGVAARGSNAVKMMPDSDCLGKLMFTREANNWEDESERKDSGKRGDRWLPDEMCPSFVEVNEKNGSLKFEGGKIREINTAVDCASMEKKDDPDKKNFYFVRLPDGSYRIEQKIEQGFADSGFKMTDFLEFGSLYAVNWKASRFELTAALKKRNSKSLALYTMLREPITPGVNFDPSNTALVGKKDLIDAALSQYGFKTRRWVGYLYIESFLRRHHPTVLKKEYGEGADISKMEWKISYRRQIVENAERAGLLDEKGVEKLKKNFHC